MGAALADADKAAHYCQAAGSALRLLAFEEAALHFARSLEVAEQYGLGDLPARCDALIALAEALNRAGDTALADDTFERAAAWRGAWATPSAWPRRPCAPGRRAFSGWCGPTRSRWSCSKRLWRRCLRARTPVCGPR